MDKLRGLPDAVRNFSRPVAEVRKQETSAERPPVPEIRLKASGSVETVASPEHPDRNEDQAFVDTERAVAILSDGVGGHAAGDEASRLAVKSIQDALPAMDVALAAERSRIGSPYVSAEAVSDLLDAVVQSSVTSVKSFSDARSKGFATERAFATLLVAKVTEVRPGERVAVFKGIGDSKAFVERSDGWLEAVDMQDGGAMDQWVANGFPITNPMTGEKRFAPLSKDEAFLIEQSSGLEQFRQKWNKIAIATDADSSDARWGDLKKAHDQYFGRSRNQINEALGKVANPKIHTAFVLLRPGDKIRLMSDGISDNLTLDEMHRNRHRLTEAAQERMAHKTSIRRKPDDATMAVLSVEAAAVPLSLPEQSRRANERDQEKIAELNTVIDADLIIMDARKCFISRGPMDGEVREPNIILASESRTAIDIEGIKIIKNYEGNSLSGIEPLYLTQIKRALEIGIK